MENTDFSKLVLAELKNINGRFDGLEWNFKNLESRFDNLENEVSKINYNLIELKDEFRDFTGLQEVEHQATRKLINQAFERINDNLVYQEKVDRIERVLKARPRQVNV